MVAHKKVSLRHDNDKPKKVAVRHDDDKPKKKTSEGITKAVGTAATVVSALRQALDSHAQEVESGQRKMTAISKKAMPPIDVDSLIVSRSQRQRRPMQFFESGNDAANSIVVERSTAPSPPRTPPANPKKKRSSKSEIPPVAAMVPVQPNPSASVAMVPDAEVPPNRETTKKRPGPKAKAPASIPALPFISGPAPAAPPSISGPAPAAPPSVTGPAPAAPPSISGPAPAAPPSIFSNALLVKPHEHPLCVVSAFVDQFSDRFGIGYSLGEVDRSGEPQRLIKPHIASGFLFSDGSTALIDAVGNVTYINAHRHRFTIRNITGKITIPERLQKKMQILLCMRAAFTAFFAAAAATLPQQQEPDAASGLPRVHAAVLPWTRWEADLLPAAGAPSLDNGPIYLCSAAPSLSACTGAAATGPTQRVFVLSQRSAPYPGKVYYCSDGTADA